MTRMLRHSSLAACALAAGLFPACPVGADPVAELSALSADVYVLGEVHDNADHHLRQATALTALAPKAVVYEMLTPDQAEIVNAAGAADPDALNWAESGWPDFAIYAPVFEASEGSVIYGGALDRAVVRRAFAEAPQDLFVEIWGGDSADAPAPEFGLAAPLPEAQQALREAEQMAAHCDALPEDILPGFVAAQRLRDAAIAGQVLAALDEVGPPVVVITGNGHARPDWGVPALLARAVPGLTVATLGQFEDAVPEDAPPFDVIAISPAAEREDPCAAFR